MVRSQSQYFTTRRRTRKWIVDCQKRKDSTCTNFYHPGKLLISLPRLKWWKCKHLSSSWFFWQAGPVHLGLPTMDNTWWEWHRQYSRIMIITSWILTVDILWQSAMEKECVCMMWMGKVKLKRASVPTVFSLYFCYYRIFGFWSRYCHMHFRTCSPCAQKGQAICCYVIWCVFLF